MLAVNLSSSPSVDQYCPGFRLLYVAVNHVQEGWGWKRFLVEVVAGDTTVPAELTISTLNPCPQLLLTSVSPMFFLGIVFCLYASYVLSQSDEKSNFCDAVKATKTVAFDQCDESVAAAVFLK